MFKVYYKFEICYILLQSDGDKLLNLDFVSEKNEEEKSCELLKFAKNELDLYFSKRLKKFQTPLKITASAFETRVYETLMKINYGEIKSYKEVANLAKSPKAFRAVGNANAKNKIPIFIPCHRVVASGSIGGYSGGKDLKNIDPLEIKKYLLRLESVDLSGFKK